MNEGFSYREQLGKVPEGESALAYVVRRYPHSSEEEWKACFARGELLLDGVTATGAERLHPGQWLVRNRPAWEEVSAPRSYELVYEDDVIVAVVKPSGLSTLPGGGFLHNTLLSVVRDTFPEASPLHRLGRATSGLVLFSRTTSAAAFLAKAWREHEVGKSYRALGAGVATQERYDIDLPIGPVHHPKVDWVHGVSAKGKASQSTAYVRERRAGQTLFDVEIRTGRPHQIRIHLAAIGHPLVGDPLYAAGGLPLTESPGLPGDGGYLLHSERLVFTHPRTGERMELRAKPPPELRAHDEG